MNKQLGCNNRHFGFDMDYFPIKQLRLSNYLKLNLTAEKPSPLLELEKLNHFIMMQIKSNKCNLILLTITFTPRI